MAVGEGSKKFLFGEFTLDLERRSLSKGGERVRITSKPLETLIFLVENRGRVVTKEELMESLWKDTFVTEDNLVHAVREIRRALNDDKGNPQYLQTVPREGYRFVGCVTSPPPAADAAAGPPAAVSGGAAAVSPVLSRRMRWTLAAATALVVVAGTIGVVRFALDRSKPAATPPGRVTAQLHTLALLTPGVRSAVKPAFSPDGKFLLYASTVHEDGGMDIFVRPVGEGLRIQITNDVHASGDMPVFTADGTHVVFSKYRAGDTTLPDLWIVPISGGTPRIYVPEACGAGFSPDNRWVAYTKYLPARTPLCMSPVDRRDQCREIAPAGFTPRWSPDGKWIAYTTSDPNEGLGFIYIVSTSLTDRRRLTTVPQQIYGLAWTADSRHVVFAPKGADTFHLGIVPISGGPVRPLTTGIGEYLSPSISPDGQTIVSCYVRPVSDLILVTTGKAGPADPITESEYHLCPRLSPSGARLASVMRQPGSDDALCITEIAARKQTCVSDRPASYPVWLNENEVAYLSPAESGNATQLRIANLTTGLNRTLTEFSAAARWLAIDTAGKQAAVVVTASDSVESIVVRDLATHRDRPIARGARYEYLRWADGGSTLSWSGPEKGADHASAGIWRSTIVEPKPSRICPEGYGPAWSSDGQFLYFCRINENSGLWRLDVKRGTPEKVYSWTEVRHYDMRGKRLLYCQGGAHGQIYSMRLALQ